MESGILLGLGLVVVLQPTVVVLDTLLSGAGAVAAAVASPVALDNMEHLHSAECLDMHISCLGLHNLGSLG